MRHLSLAHGAAPISAIDSAGIADWHQGKPADPRSIRTAKRFGIDMSSLRARQVRASDFDDYDRIYGMDQGHVDALLALAAARAKASVLAFGALAGTGDIEDPYYGGDDGFVKTFQDINAGCKALLERLQAGNI
ncbi:MAG: low molecular weight phosphotyrosine protein phosphatase [Neomegalonema sp.]|nr:low molecular weight phosphotyrosine protein phosphatase [Neomegalonema sp.]